MEPYTDDPPLVKGILILEFDGNRVFLLPVADSDEDAATLIKAFVAKFGATLEMLQ